MFLPYAFVAGLALIAQLPTAYAQQSTNVVSIPSAASESSIPSNIQWLKIPQRAQSNTLSRGVDPSIVAFGIAWGEHTEEKIKDHNFLVTALEIMENIYEEHSNYDELVSNYAWGSDFGTPPLNISAVGRGKDVGKPYTFNNGAMVLFIRWLGQTTPPFRRITFRCYFTWLPGPGQVPQEFEVAEGIYTPWENTGTAYSGPSNDTSSTQPIARLDGSIPSTDTS